MFSLGRLSRPPKHLVEGEEPDEEEYEYQEPISDPDDKPAKRRKLEDMEEESE